MVLKKAEEQTEEEKAAVLPLGPREEQNRRKKRSPSHNNPFLFSRGECGVATAIEFSLNLAASNQEAAQ